MSKVKARRVKASATLILISISLVLAFQNCSSSFEVAPHINSSLGSNPDIPLPPPGDVIEGRALYANNCQACHSPLAVSTKMGRTADQISNSLSVIPEMRHIRLTPLEIEVIASALAPAPNVPITYALAADKYFSQPETSRAPKRISRLTRDQLEKTVLSLFSNYSLSSIKSALPPDPLISNYEFSEVLSFNQPHVSQRPSQYVS